MYSYCTTTNKDSLNPEPPMLLLRQVSYCTFHGTVASLLLNVDGSRLIWVDNIACVLEADTTEIWELIPHK